jgi:hypothetical protein
MKILVIICSNEMNSIHLPNIEIMYNYLKKYDNSIVEYCGISNRDDFNNYESIISFKYKIICHKKQLSKMCDFITQYKNELDYDWYIKFRPDIIMLEPINFDILSDTAINARARSYNGPKHIKYGMSINGEGVWRNIGDCYYNIRETNIIIDDQVYIFHQNVVKMGAFNHVNDGNREDEWFHTNIFKSRNIGLNPIGLYLQFTKRNVFSGHINM